MMMMIPEAWDDNPLMDEKRRAFYEYHAALIEPWDGPAAVAFTDGRMIGATLDRNGLRPARYVITDDDLCVMSSEAGVLSIPEERIVKKWRLQPGRMFLIDLEQGRIIDDAELKEELAASRPYQQCLRATQIRVEKLPPEIGPMTPDPQTLLDRQQAFGYTQEDIRFFLQPMSLTGEDPVGSMGRDTPIAVLSDRPKMLYDYFKQCFAQVTNPPIDPIREELVMSLVSLIGPRPNLLEPEGAAGHKRLEVRTPILSNVDLERVPDRKPRRQRLSHLHTRHHLCRGGGRGRYGPGAGAAVREGEQGRARGLQHRHPLRPGDGRRSHRHPGAAGDGGRAPLPDPRGAAHLGRPRRRDRRGAASARLLPAGRLRRRSDQPLSGLRYALQPAR